MPTLRNAALQIASELPVGDPARRKILAALQVQSRMSGPFRVIPSKAGVEYSQIEAIQPDFKKLERMFGNKTELTAEGWVWGSGPATKAGQDAYKFIQANLKKWEFLATGTSSSMGFKNFGSGLVFPNGEAVGTFTHDDTYEDERRYGHGAFYRAPEHGPSISDPKFPDWYFAAYVKLPTFLLHPDIYDPISLFLNETRVDPSNWRSHSGSKSFRTGKQGYFFKMRLKEAGETLQRASAGLEVAKFRVNHGRKINPSTGKGWVSSVTLVVVVQPPGASEPLQTIELKANYDGLQVGLKVNGKYAIDD